MELGSLLSGRPVDTDPKLLSVTDIDYADYDEKTTKGIVFVCSVGLFVSCEYMFLCFCVI